MKSSTVKDLKAILLADEWIVKILKKHADLELPDSWIGAGFVRNKVWDVLHETITRTPLNDIDIIYFDKSDSINNDILEKQLNESFPEVEFSLKNQAVMHMKHNHLPYKDSEEAIQYWVETATAIAVRWNGDEIECIAPYGVKDLFNLKLKPIDSSKIDVLKQRAKDKRWLELWLKLKIS